MPKSVKRPAESWRYVLQRDRALPVEEQSVFVLRPMTVAARAAAHDNISRLQVSPTGNRTVIGRMRQEALAIAQAHIVSTERFPSERPQPWPTDPAAQLAYIELLEDDDILELGSEIWARSAVATESLLGNSLPPERTSTSGGDSPASTSTTASSVSSTPA